MPHCPKLISLVLVMYFKQRVLLLENMFSKLLNNWYEFTITLLLRKYILALNAIQMLAKGDNTENCVESEKQKCVIF